MMVATRKFLVLYLLVVTGVVIVHGNPGLSSINPKKAFVPRRGVSSQQTVVKDVTTSVANPPVNNKGASKEPVIDPVLAGKVVTAAYLVQGALLQLAPSQQLGFCGMQDRTDATHALCRDFGSDMVATGIVSYLSLIEKTSAKKAAGTAFLYLFMTTLVTLLADRQGAIGANNKLIFARLVVTALGAASTLLIDSEENKPDDLAKFAVYLRLIEGIFGVLFPNKVGDIMGLSWEDSPANHYMVRAVGFSTTWVSVTMAALVNGVGSYRSVGYGNLATLSYIVCQKFITKEWEGVGMTAGKNLAWMAFFFVMTLGEGTFFRGD